jgi:hypothetical protein
MQSSIFRNFIISALNKNQVIYDALKNKPLVEMAPTAVTYQLDNPYYSGNDPNRICCVEYNVSEHNQIVINILIEMDKGLALDNDIKSIKDLNPYLITLNNDIYTISFINFI